MRVYAEYFDNNDYVHDIVERMSSNCTNNKASFNKQGLFVSCVAQYMVFYVVPLNEMEITLWHCNSACVDPTMLVWEAATAYLVFF